MANKFYAYVVLQTGKRGITDNWDACEKIVKGKEARYRSFKTKAEAEKWLTSGAQYEVKERPNIRKGIYFDAGTGRGLGVEISVTDERGRDVLHRVVPEKKINEFGKHRLPEGFTNNYGELLAMHHALRYAMKQRVKNVFGDSKLVLEYWSRGFSKTKGLPKETLNLISKVKKLRQKFESTGGRVQYVEGKYNPADLGFHK